MVTVLMMSAKLPALDPLKIKVFWNKDYGLVTGTRYSVESLDQCGKRVEIKSPKFWRLISMFVEATVGKLVEGLFPVILNRVKASKPGALVRGNTV